MAIQGLTEEEFFVAGHRACAGCGPAIALRLFTKAAGKNTVLCESTGCMEVVSSPYPETAWNLPWIHMAFENAAAVASGIAAALKRQKREHLNVIAFAGDGSSFDIGFQAISGVFERGDNITYICYDNEAYMNTGIQRSGATPYGASTTTSPAGKMSIGKTEWKKDLPHIIAAHGAPYVATASIGYPADFVRKVKKALEIKGPTFVHVLACCPTGWRCDTAKTVEISKLAVECGVFPLYEIINGKHILNRPKEIKKPVRDYLKMQGRFKHLKDEDIKYIEENVKARFEFLKKYVESGL